MNRNITRIVAIAATLAMGTSLAACGGSSADSSKGHVYFMNNKAEVVDQYKELASMYTKKTGVQVDAVISQSLIKNIFFNKAALHDGAMIIRDNRIAAAGCFLPLTQNTQISKDKGTRHRAGVGVSEVSDAVVFIVSEVTGEISLALGGSLLGGQNYTTLRQQLTQLLFGDTRRKGKKDKKDKKKRAAAAAAAGGEAQDSGTDK